GGCRDFPFGRRPRTLSKRFFFFQPVLKAEKCSPRQKSVERSSDSRVWKFSIRAGGWHPGRSVMKLRTATLAAVLLAASIPSLPSAAQARPFCFHGGWAHGVWGHGGWGWGGAGLGLAAGAIIG